MFPDPYDMVAAATYRLSVARIETTWIGLGRCDGQQRRPLERYVKARVVRTE